MSDDRKVNLVVVAENQTKGTFQEIKADAAGVGSAVEQAGAKAEAGLNRIGNAAGKAAEGLATAGKEATQAAGSLGGVGAGADAAGQGVERASRNMIAAIQRATAELEAGKKGTASYYEAIARQRGVGSDVLEPYLAQLRKAEDAHKAVARSTQNTGASAAQMAAQVTRNLGGMDQSSIASAAHMDRLSLSLGGVVAAGAGLGLVSKLISSIAGAAATLPREGFNFAKDLEVSAVGMAGIIGSVTTLHGKQTQYNDALSISQGMILKLNDDALRTAASSKELVSTFQALLAPGLAAGMNLEQIRELTVVGANAVKSMGLGSHQLVQELRDLVAGGITASSSTLATSLGLKDSDIAKAKASSEGLFSFLMERLKGFEKSSEAFGGTLQGKLDQLKEGSIRAASDGMKPLTDAIGQTAGELSNLIIQVDGSKNVQISPQLVSGLQDTSEKLVSIGNTAKGTLQGLWEYRDVVTGVVAAWAAFKVGSIVSDIAAAGAATIARAEASRFAAVQSAAEAAANEAVALTSTQKTAAYIAELQANVTRTAAQVAATSGTVAAAAAERAHALALTQLEVAQAAASRSSAAFGAVVGALGGPVGIGVAALTGLLGVLYSISQESNNLAKVGQSKDRVSAATAEGRAAESRDITRLQSQLEQLKEQRDELLLQQKSGDGLFGTGFLAGDFQTGTISKLKETTAQIQQIESTLTAAKRASDGAATSTGDMTTTLETARRAWEKANEHIKTATGIHEQYKEKLESYTRDHEKIRADMVKTGETEANLAAMEQRFAEGKKRLAKEEADAIKNLADKGTAAAAKRQQTADNELATLKAKLSTAIELGAQLRGQLEAEGTGAVYSKQTDGEKEAALWLAKANVQRDQSVKALMLEKAALAQQRGEQEKANKAMEDAIAVQQKQVASVQQRIQSLTKEAENLEAANAAYGKSEAAIEALNAQRAQDAVGIAMSLGDSQQLIDQLTEEWKATVRLNAAKAESRYKKSDEGLDAGIATAKAQAALYEDEYRLIGMSAVERAKIVALRKVEVDLAKELDKIDRSGLNDPEKAKQRAKAEEKAQIERSTAVNKVLQDDFFHTSGQIETSLTDALMRGFGRGGSFAQGLADEAERVFESMVLRPTFAAASRPVAGAITNAIGSFGNPGQAGSGILGSVASSAIGTAITSGFAEVAAGYSGATLAAGLAGPTTAGATGLMGVGNMLAAVPGWGWALAGAAALMASGVGSSIGEVHSGGIYSTSSPSDMTTAMRVTQDDSAAARDLVNRANTAISKPLELVGKGLVKTFDDLAKMLGTASDQFDLTLGFAADLSGESKDKNAFGYFDLVDKATGDTLASYKNRALGTDTTAAMTKLTNDAARAMLDALAKANIPAWAEHALAKLGDVEGLDALAQFAAWPKTLLTQFGADRDALVQQFAEGLATTDAATAGQNVALSLVSSIEQTVMTAGAGQIFDIMNTGMIAPMLDAIATGTLASEAMSKSSMDAVVANMTAHAQAINTLFSDVNFKAALDQIKTNVGSALGAAGAAMNYQPTYWKPDVSKAKEEQSAAEKAAEDLAKRIKDALNGLKTDGLSLQIELLRAQGNDAAAAVMELNKATEGWDAANREIYRQRLADNAAVKEQIRAQQSLNALHEESGNLAIQLLRAQGQEEAALSAERKAATKLMTDAELGVYDYNRALERQIAAEESLGNLRNEGATLSVNLMRALEQNEQALSREREIAIAGMSALEVAQYDANKATEKLIDGISKIKGAFDTAKSSLNLGGIPSVGSVSTTGLTQAGALEANIKNLQTYLSARDQDYANLIAEITKPVVGKETLASYLGMPTDIPGLQSLSAPSIGAMMDKVGQLAATLASSDPAAFNQWGKFLENVVTGLGTLNGYNQEYGKTTQALEDAEFSLGEVRREEAKKLSAFAAEIASAKSQADIALLKAQGKAEQAAALERESYIAGLVDLTAEQVAAKVSAYDYTKAIEQQVAVLQQRQGLEQSIAQALGQTALLRERELAALDASNRPLQMRLYALTDAATAMDAALAGVQRATDAEKAQISKSAAAQIEALRTGIDAGAKSTSDAQAQVGTLSGLFDNIADAVKSLRGNVNPELDLLHARSYIDMSLSLARAGTMPDATKLRDAISAVGKDTADAYRTMADFEFAQLVQAGKLEQLGGLVAAQKSVEERQLDSLNGANRLSQDQISAIEKSRDAQLTALDQQLKAAQDQAAVMKGVDTSVQSVAAALVWLSAAMQAQAVVKAQAQASMATVVIQNANGTSSQYTPDPVRYTPPSASFTLPGFATGGMHAGGLRVVGERGMEIEATGPARYWNAADTQQFLNGGGTSARLEQLFEQLLARIEALEQQGNEAKTARAELLRLWDQVTEGGNAIRADIVATSV